MLEEKINFRVSKGVFYNPNMEFCRSFSSLAVGAIGEKISVCDAFCASGIRGLRYIKENKNVKDILSLDIDKKATNDVSYNFKKNKIKGKVLKGNLSRVVFDISADFLEIDPFGTPSPYIYDSMRIFNPYKRAYFSVTATDVAVLCGGKTKACLKNYGAIPLNNEFTHETGMRIMLKKIVDVAAEFNFGVKPLVSLSDRHYLKTIVLLERSAENAYLSQTHLGHVSYCNSCAYYTISKFPSEKCPSCKKNLAFAGPLWLGSLHENSFVKKMFQLNQKRDYSQKRQLDKTLTTIIDEASMPQFYYDLHKLAQRAGLKRLLPTEKVLENIQSRGYRAVRTHFSLQAIKTTAPLKIIKECI